MARTVSSSVAPSRTLGQTGSSGLRVSIITAQRRAIASVLSQASGRSANKRAHDGGGLEPMLWRDAAAVLFGQQAAFGDAEQGVVRLEHRGGGEEAVVGGDQRQAQRVGQGDHAGFDGLLVRQAVAVQFHHRAVGKGFGGLAQPALGFGLLAVGQEAGERPGGAAGQQDQAGGVLGDAIERELRLQAGIGVEEAARGQALQVGEAGCVLREQDDLARAPGAGCRGEPGRAGSR